MNPGGAPALQDQPSVTADLDVLLAEAGVPRSLTPEQLQAARVCDLRLDGEGGGGEGGDPAAGNPEPGQPGNGGEGGESEITLDTFDPTQIPEDANREWLAERHQQLVADYTRKTQGSAEERREAEQAQAIVAGLQNPELFPHFLKMLGHDPTDPQFLDVLGLEPAEEAELGELELEPDEGERLDRIESMLQQRERQEFEAEQAEQAQVAALEYIGGEIERLEGESPLDESEIAIVRNFAETHADSRGMPDVKGGIELLRGIISRHREQFIESRKAPRVPGGGSPGSKTADLSTPAGRQEAAIAAAERAMASEQ